MNISGASDVSESRWCGLELNCGFQRLSHGTVLLETLNISCSENALYSLLNISFSGCRLISRVGSLVESCSRGTGNHEDSSDWAEENRQCPKVHCQGDYKLLIPCRIPRSRSYMISMPFAIRIEKDFKSFLWYLMLNCTKIWQDTVEERLQQVQARKQRMIAGALTDEEVRSARIEELKMLFR